MRPEASRPGRARLGKTLEPLLWNSVGHTAGHEGRFGGFSHQLSVTLSEGAHRCLCGILTVGSYRLVVLCGCAVQSIGKVDNGTGVPYI